MASKAEKLRQRRNRARGRPCKTDVDRTDTGRIRQGKKQGPPPDKLSREVRARMYGIDEAKAGQQEYGSVIGRLYKSGQMDEKQYRALVKYREDYARFQSTVQTPDSLRSKDGTGGGGEPDEEYQIAVMRRWNELKSSIRVQQLQSNGNLQAALSHVALRDEDFPHMYGDLRIAANSLVRYYGISH